MGPESYKSLSPFQLSAKTEKIAPSFLKCNSQEILLCLTQMEAVTLACIIHYPIQAVVL